MMDVRRGGNGNMSLGTSGSEATSISWDDGMMGCIGIGERMHTQEYC